MCSDGACYIGLATSLRRDALHQSAHFNLYNLLALLFGMMQPLFYESLMGVIPDWRMINNELAMTDGEDDPFVFHHRCTA